MKNSTLFIKTNLLLVLLVVTVSYCTPQSLKGTAVDDLAVIHLEKTAAEPITAKNTSRKPLTLVIKNLASSTAPVIIGIYASNYKFLYKESRLKEYSFIPKRNTLKVQITDIDYGEIAVAIYQDMNNNGEFDKNLIGIPTEGYCFSNNFKPTIKAPEYADCKFKYNLKNNKITMNFIK